jgi:DNA polymerase V
MKQPIFALVDCNNFFVSCERLFRPDLIGKPVVVLSSNDGCVVARSNEAKALGIPMGAPAFKYRQLLANNKVVQFSANFELYGNISKRITEFLAGVTPRIEVYSVDESFLDLGNLSITNYVDWATQVRQQILDQIGIPVSIGIATSKTLAKIATEHAKTKLESGGVCDLTKLDGDERQSYLQSVPVKDVWGVGRRLTPQLQALGVLNAAALADMRPNLAQQLMGIRGKQLVMELNGQNCLPFEAEHKPTQSISRTRTFGADTNQAHILESAIASFAAQAAFRLRGSQQLTRRASLFLTTDRHKPNYQRQHAEVVFAVPTADTGEIISILIARLSQMYKKSVQYHRAGVLLYDFVPISGLQTDLLGTVNINTHQKSQARMKAVDSLNSRFGQATLRYATEGLGNAWQPKHTLRSPRYVSHWGELAIVRPCMH